MEEFSFLSLTSQKLISLYLFRQTERYGRKHIQGGNFFNLLIKSSYVPFSFLNFTIANEKGKESYQKKGVSYTSFILKRRN